ncbi:MAG: O-antigen ligase family protein [Candidatus Omnitrophota bacterium]
MKIDKAKTVFFLDKAAAWSLYAIIFTLPFSKSMVEISIVIGILSVVAKKIIVKERFVANTHIEILLYIFIMASLISIFNTQASQMGLSMKALFSKVLKFAALFLIAKDVINTREKLKDFLIIASLSCVIIVIDAFVQYYVTHMDFLHNYPAFLYRPEVQSVRGVPTASFPFQNDFAAWILVFIFPALCLAIFGKIGRRGTVFAVSAFIGLLYLLILTKVRGAWIAFVISFIILSVVKLKKAGWALLVVIVLLGLAYNGRNIMSRPSINDRSVMWNNGMTIFMRHPVIGNGLNTFYDNYMKVREDKHKNIRGSYAHNCYLQMAADIGLAGLAAFLLFAIAVLASGFRALKAAGDPLCYSLILGISLGLIAFLVHSSGDTNLYSLPLAALFWLSSGILLAVVKISGPRSGA